MRKELEKKKTETQAPVDEDGKTAEMSYTGDTAMGEATSSENDTFLGKWAKEEAEKEAEQVMKGKSDRPYIQVRALTNNLSKT